MSIHPIPISTVALEQTCDTLQQLLSMTSQELFNHHCLTLLDWSDDSGALADEADARGEYTVACGLYAISYRLAGTSKLLADVALQAGEAAQGSATRPARAAMKRAVRWRCAKPEPVTQTLQHYRSALKELAQQLQHPCCAELLNGTYDLQVLLEHPKVMSHKACHAALMQIQESLSDLADHLYETASQLEAHAVMILH